jgi:hypothetical protein
MSTHQRNPGSFNCALGFGLVLFALYARMVHLGKKPWAPALVLGAGYVGAAIFLFAHAPEYGTILYYAGWGGFLLLLALDLIKNRVTHHGKV